MAAGAFLPLAVFIGIVGSVGFRLIRLWHRSRELPELCLGSGLVIVASSMPLCAAGRVPELAMETTGRVCFSAGLATAAIGITLVVFFNYWVFRRESWWGRVLLALASASLLASVSYMSAMNFLGPSVVAIKASMRPGTVTLMGTVLACFLWGAGESFHYYRSSRRQQSLGLADPVVTNRLLLWGIASATCSALLVVIMACVLWGMTIMREPGPLLAISATGCIMSASWYLTFFAPESYLAFIRDRAQNP